MKKKEWRDGRSDDRDWGSREWKESGRTDARARPGAAEWKDARGDDWRGERQGRGESGRRAEAARGCVR